MLEKFLILILLMVGGGLSHAQAPTVYATQDTAYIRHVEAALQYLQQGDCRNCLGAYNSAFRIAQKSHLSLLRAASCAYACKEEKLAGQYLDKALAIDWAGTHDLLATYPEFKPYRNTPFEQDLLSRQNRRIQQLGLDAGLIRELARIREADQRYRSQVDSVAKTYGWDSVAIKTLHRRMQVQDSLNLVQLEKLIARHGYPGKSKVGSVQATTAFLVIQHSPLPVMEKHFPLLKTAAERGELDRASFAMFTDRIRVYKGEKQIYGTQVYKKPDSDAWELHPLEDPEHVHQRRAEMGLEPLRDFLKQYNIDFPPKG